MDLWIILVFVALMMAMDYFVIRTLIRAGWSPLERFPPQPPGPQSIRRNFQSFRIGLCNYGCCIHAEADDTHLHLHPAAFIRALGCGAVSIPWDQLTITRRKGKWVDAKIGHTTVRGPAWCLEMASAQID